MSFDPLVASPDDPEMARVRAELTVPQNQDGVWFLSRFRRYSGGIGANRSSTERRPMAFSIASRSAGDLGK